MSVHAAITAAREAAPWYHDRDEQLAFGRALVDAGLLTTAAAMLDFLAAPTLWDEAHAAWIQRGCPDPNADAEEDRARWIAVEAIARGFQLAPAAPAAVRSATVRVTWGLTHRYVTRNCFGRCSVCRQEMWDVTEQGTIDPHRPDKDEPSRCAECGYWSAMAATTYDSRRVVVSGAHHILADAPASAPANAPAFSIEFFDGRRGRGYLVSQGVIPEVWRSKLPDNARIAAEPRHRRASA